MQMGAAAYHMLRQVMRHEQGQLPHQRLFGMAAVPFVGLQQLLVDDQSIVVLLRDVVAGIRVAFAEHKQVPALAQHVLAKASSSCLLCHRLRHSLCDTR